MPNSVVKLACCTAWRKNNFRYPKHNCSLFLHQNNIIYYMYLVIYKVNYALLCLFLLLFNVLFPRWFNVLSLNFNVFYIVFSIAFVFGNLVIYLLVTFSFDVAFLVVIYYIITFPWFLEPIDLSGSIIPNVCRFLLFWLLL